MIKRAVLTGMMLLAISPCALAQKSLPPGDPGNNDPPPPGAILDLSGTRIPGGGNFTYSKYVVNFSATLDLTYISFAFRDDPAFLYFSSPSVTDLTTSSGNLLTNSDFSQGTYTSGGDSSVPTGWIYANPYGASNTGFVGFNCGVGPSGNFGVGNCFEDGTVQAYDSLSQAVVTTPGHTYRITYWIADSSFCIVDGGPPCNFSDLSTNGDVTDPAGNGINVTVYAGALPLPAPPSCQLSAVVAGPPKQLQISMQSTGSGLQSIQLTGSINSSVYIPVFSPGTHNPVIVTATKLNQSLSSDVAFQVTDLGGLTTACDPVDFTVTMEGFTERHAFGDLPATEHYIRILNGTPGVRRMRFEVNGQFFAMATLKDGDSQLLDVGSAMISGSSTNKVVMYTSGPRNASAYVVVGDSSVE